MSYLLTVDITKTPRTSLVEDVTNNTSKFPTSVVLGDNLPVAIVFVEDNTISSLSGGDGQLQLSVGLPGGTIKAYTDSFTVSSSYGWTSTLSLATQELNDYIGTDAYKKLYLELEYTNPTTLETRTYLQTDITVYNSVITASFNPTELPEHLTVSQSDARYLKRDDNVSGSFWLLNGNYVHTSYETYSVGIGTTSPTEKLDVRGNVYVSGFLKGNVTGTSSWASQAVVSADADHATSADDAQSATYAISAGTAGTASYVASTVSSSYSVTSSYARLALDSTFTDWAIFADTAATASYVISALTASHALTAVTASHVLSSSYVTVAATSVSSSYATNALYAQTSSYSITTTNQVTSVSSASWASSSLSSSYARVAQTASILTSNGVFTRVSGSTIDTLANNWILTAVTNSVITADNTFQVSADYINLNADVGVLVTGKASIYNLAGTGSLVGTASYAVSASYFGNGTSGYVPVWQNNTLSPTSSIVATGTLVGINKTNPQHTVDASGSSFAFGSTNTGSNFRLVGEYQSAGDTFTDNDISLIFHSNTRDRIKIVGDQISQGSDDYDLRFDFIKGDLSGHNTWMYIDGQSGRVGIGNTAPQTTLHVTGQISASGVTAATFTGLASTSTSSSYARTASFASNSATASFWNSSSLVTLVNTKQDALVTGNTYSITSSWANNWNSSSLVALVNTKQNTIPSGSLVPFTSSYALTASAVFATNTVVNGSDTLLLNGQNSVDVTTQVGNIQLSAATDLDLFAVGVIRLNKISASNGWFGGTSRNALTASLADTASYAINWNSSSLVSLVNTKQDALVTGNTYSVTSSWANNAVTSTNALTASSVYATNTVVNGSDTLLLNGQNSVDVTTQVGNIQLSAATDLDLFAVNVIRLNKISASNGWLGGTSRNALTASLASNANLLEGYNASYFQPALVTGVTYPITSSWAVNWNSSSVVSLINTKQDVLVTGGNYAITSSWAGQATVANDADHATAADEAQNATYAVSAGTAATASYWNSSSIVSLINTKQDVLVTGGTYNITSSWANNWNSSSVVSLINTKQNTLVTGGNYSITASWAGQATVANDADHATSADDALSANYAISAGSAGTSVSASHALIANSSLTTISASHALKANTAISASYAPFVVSSSSSYATYAETAGNADFLDGYNSAEFQLDIPKSGNVYLITASWVANGGSSVSASHALRADNAISAAYASTANVANDADHATSADDALSANYATSAGTAGSATTAVSASHALKANSVQPNSVVLGTDTTGNYAGRVSAGANINVGGTPGENTNYTVSLENTISLAKVSATELNGALNGNATSATTAISASHALKANTATSATTATNATYAVSASYAPLPPGSGATVNASNNRLVKYNSGANELVNSLAQDDGTTIVLGNGAGTTTEITGGLTLNIGYTTDVKTFSGAYLEITRAGNTFYLPLYS